MPLGPIAVKSQEIMKVQQKLFSSASSNPIVNRLSFTAALDLQMAAPSPARVQAPTAGQTIKISLDFIEIRGANNKP